MRDYFFFIVAVERISWRQINANVTSIWAAIFDGDSSRGFSVHSKIVGVKRFFVALIEVWSGQRWLFTIFKISQQERNRNRSRLIETRFLAIKTPETVTYSTIVAYATKKQLIFLKLRESVWNFWWWSERQTYVFMLVTSSSGLQFVRSRTLLIDKFNFKGLPQRVACSRVSFWNYKNLKGFFLLDFVC